MRSTRSGSPSLTCFVFVSQAGLPVVSGLGRFPQAVHSSSLRYGIRTATLALAAGRTFCQDSVHHWHVSPDLQAVLLRACWHLGRVPKDGLFGHFKRPESFVGNEILRSSCSVSLNDILSFSIDCFCNTRSFSAATAPAPATASSR